MTSSRFSITRILCFVLVLLWLIKFMIHGDLAVLHGLAMTVVDCTMVWQLLSGILDYARQRHRYDLVQRTAACRLGYVLVMTGAQIFTLAIHDLSNITGLLLVVLFVTLLVLMVLILQLIHRVKVELLI